MFGKQHPALKGPCMIRMVAQFFDAIAAAVGGFGQVFCHDEISDIGRFNEG